MTDNKKDILWRVYLLYFSVFFFGIVIIARIIHIQFVEGDIWKNKSKEMTMRYFPVEEMRGSILAMDGSILATSIPIFDLRMDLATNHVKENFSKKVDSLASSLSNLFKDRSKREYKNLLIQAFKEQDRFLLLQKDINYNQLKEVRRFPLFRDGRFKGGMVIVEKNRREMPFKMLAMRTIGYEKEGVTVGLEGSYNKYLRGMSGRVLMQKLSNGRWKPVENKNDIEPKDGNDIVTTIDVTLQDVAEDALYRCLFSNKAEYGCVIVMEVKSGEIRAIANLGLRPDSTYGETMNYAISDRGEPGSTFKLASLMVALEDNQINLDDTVDIENGVHYFFSQKMKDSHPTPLRRISVKKAFEISSNVGISKVIYKAYYQNPENWVNGLYRMSLNKPLELDIPGEKRPIIKAAESKEFSKYYSLPWMSIGYELALTPIQTLTFYNAVANDGVMVKPMFVREIRQSGEVVESFEPQIINKAICSKSTISKAKEMLEGVVLNGTGKKLFNTVYSIAGKTGTAKIAKDSKGYDSTNYKASFVGYFPADHPKYTIIVIVNKPRAGKFYGGEISAPVFKEIADKVYATQLDLHEDKSNISISRDLPRTLDANRYDLSKVMATLGYPHQLDESSQWVTQVADSTRLVFQGKTQPNGLVPDVTGMGAKDAIYLLERSGYRVRIKGKGAIIRQSPEPGTKSTKNKTVTLELASLQP